MNNFTPEQFMFAFLNASMYNQIPPPPPPHTLRAFHQYPPPQQQFQPPPINLSININDKGIPILPTIVPSIVPTHPTRDIGTPFHKLYVKNLSKHTTESDLFNFFSKHRCLDVLVGKGKLKCQGFATFPSVELATKALVELQDNELQGKKVNIYYGRPIDEDKQEREKKAARMAKIEEFLAKYDLEEIEEAIEAKRKIDVSVKKRKLE